MIFEGWIWLVVVDKFDYIKVEFNYNLVNCGIDFYMLWVNIFWSLIIIGNKSYI